MIEGRGGSSRGSCGRFFRNFAAGPYDEIHVDRVQVKRLHEKWYDRSIQDYPGGSHHGVSAARQCS